MKGIRILGHPVHQMLIVFPLGLLATSVFFDIIYLLTGNAAWTSASMYLIGAGIIGGLLAAFFGAADWWAIPDATRAKRVGMLHGIGNVVVVAMFIASWYLRTGYIVPPQLAFALSFAGLGLALVTAWLGGELVTRMGVGVDPGAHVNAPSSLLRKQATGTTTEERLRRAG
jgi:uncharacterized membrane protein